METASFFAKKHGLEEYLNRPGGPIALLFKLPVLSDSMMLSHYSVMRSLGTPVLRSAFTNRPRWKGAAMVVDALSAASTA